ncbi:MAG: hypothetical protein AB7R40_24915 [Nitrospiraceae bacterium]
MLIAYCNSTRRATRQLYIAIEKPLIVRAKATTEIMQSAAVDQAEPLLAEFRVHACGGADHRFTRS